jgi:hypothetical protein
MAHSKHPVAGTSVSARLGTHHGVARVERLRRKKDGRIVLVVRLHGGPDIMVETGNTWADAASWYQGLRMEVPVTSVRSVLPGENEAWVDAEDFFDWAEADAS